MLSKKVFIALLKIAFVSILVLNLTISLDNQSHSLKISSQGIEAAAKKNKKEDGIIWCCGELVTLKVCVEGGFWWCTPDACDCNNE